MVLASAHYRLLEGEEDWFAADEAKGWHQLDGEICLHFSDAPPIYISWGAQRVVYSIEFGGSSFFSGGTLRSVDLSAHTWWRDFVGRELRLDHVDPEHQILRIRADSAKLFLSSQYDDGGFLGDCVRVSPREPTP